MASADAPPSPSSRIEGFAGLPMDARRGELVARGFMTEELAAAFVQSSGDALALADRLSENVIGVIGLPVGIATNLIVDGNEVLVPMASEESSVVAAVCNAAKRCRATGGMVTSATAPVMIAQIQQYGMSDPETVRMKILERRDEIAAICNAVDPILLKLGGGFRDIEVRVIDSAAGPMVITHLLVDTRDAMGANAVNTMAETLAPRLAEWTDAPTQLRILSNLADRRLARARARWLPRDVGGPEVVDAMLRAHAFADADPYRAATHNKGIMNGVTAVALVTGNDTRAIEAGAHAFAARSGRYRAMSHWEKDAEGALVGTLEMPMAVGLVGGATKLHPVARAALSLMGVTSAEGLARLIVAVGLAQNFAALRVLSTTGVQQGHMALHAQNIAMMAGAREDEIDRVAKELRRRGTVRLDVAEAVLTELRNG
ncbi:MAG: hydroxymethylglutaryl-CoA reductase, degradative [Alkalilacustris sp.]